MRWYLLIVLKHTIVCKQAGDIRTVKIDYKELAFALPNIARVQDWPLSDEQADFPKEVLS